MTGVAFVAGLMLVLLPGCAAPASSNTAATSPASLTSSTHPDAVDPARTAMLPVAVAERWFAPAANATAAAAAHDACPQVAQGADGALRVAWPRAGAPSLVVLEQCNASHARERGQPVHAASGYAVADAAADLPFRTSAGAGEPVFVFRWVNGEVTYGGRVVDPWREATNGATEPMADGSMQPVEEVIRVHAPATRPILLVDAPCA